MKRSISIIVIVLAAAVIFPQNALALKEETPKTQALNDLTQPVDGANGYNPRILAKDLHQFVFWQKDAIKTGTEHIGEVYFSQREGNGRWSVPVSFNTISSRNIVRQNSQCTAANLKIDTVRVENVQYTPLLIADKIGVVVDTAVTFMTKDANGVPKMCGAEYETNYLKMGATAVNILRTPEDQKLARPFYSAASIGKSGTIHIVTGVRLGAPRQMNYIYTQIDSATDAIRSKTSSGRIISAQDGIDIRSLDLEMKPKISVYGEKLFIVDLGVYMGGAVTEALIECKREPFEASCSLTQTYRHASDRVGFTVATGLNFDYMPISVIATGGSAMTGYTWIHNLMDRAAPPIYWKSNKRMPPPVVRISADNKIYLLHEYSYNGYVTFFSTLNPDMTFAESPSFVLWRPEEKAILGFDLTTVPEKDQLYLVFVESDGSLTSATASITK